MYRDRFTPYVEQGRHEFSFRFGYGKIAELENAAQEFTDKTYSLHFFPHGDGYDFSGGVTVDNPALSLVALYRDGEGYTLRLINNSESAAETALTVFGATKNIRFAPFEVKILSLVCGVIEEKVLWV